MLQKMQHKKRHPEGCLSQYCIKKNRLLNHCFEVLIVRIFGEFTVILSE